MHKLIFVFAIFFILSSCINSKLGRDDNVKARNKFLKPYADSINNSTAGSKVPGFLFNPCFDDDPYYWNGMHVPISLRELVIKKVRNKEALSFLLTNFTKELSIKCPKKVDSSVIYTIRIPLIDKSFYDLLTHRLEQLK